MTARPPSSSANVLLSATRRVALLGGECANDSSAHSRELHVPSETTHDALREVRDPYVARAIAAMEAAPTKRWTVATLARTAGLSRAAFARRFQQAIGTSPLRWLTAHRLRIAERRLRETEDTLVHIAIDVGYESEFALSKAFKRAFGVAPAIFRRFVRGLDRSVPTSSFRAAA